jgi:hypothetical protein
MRGFLSATEARRAPKWRTRRESGEALCQDARLRDQMDETALAGHKNRWPAPHSAQVPVRRRGLTPETVAFRGEKQRIGV